MSFVAGDQERKSTGVRCRDATGVRVPCCPSSPPPPPPPPPPPTTCGTCNFTAIPYSYRITLSGTTVGTDCCAVYSIFLDSRSLISTIDGVWCLSQIIDSAACAWGLVPPDTTFWTTNPDDATSNPCGDPPSGNPDTLNFDFRELSDGTYRLQIFNGGGIVFWAVFSFPAPCASIAVANSLNVSDICVNKFGSYTILGGGGSALIEIADCAPDICARTGTDVCAETVHVSAVGGFFDGFEQDITRADPVSDPHTWGDPNAFCSTRCAYIQCISGTLTLTIRSDVAGPCFITYTADGTGPCPTGRTWTLQSGSEGCEAPTSVSVT